MYPERFSNYSYYWEKEQAMKKEIEDLKKEIEELKSKLIDIA